MIENEPTPTQQLKPETPQEPYPSEIILEEWLGGQRVETQIDADTVEDATWLS